MIQDGFDLNQIGICNFIFVIFKDYIIPGMPPPM
jgi:hypothetical protein